MGETTKSRSARARPSGNGTVPRANGPKTANGSSRRLAPESDSLERALVDASVDCVIAFDPTGHVVEWNPAAELTFGYSRERALGADIVELMVPPDKHELERGRLRQIAASPPPSGARAEREGIRANGERFPIEVTITCIETPEPVIVTLVRDISRDRVKARRLAALTSLANQVLRGAPLEDLGIAVAVMVREELPAEVVRIWHRPPAADDQELVAAAGDDGAGRYPPPPVSEDEAGVIELEDGVAFQISMPNAPAIAIALHGGAGLVTDDLALLESSCQLLIGSASLNGTVEALADAERRYRGLIERLPVVSYLADYGPGGQWTFVSPQIENLLGYSAEEWIGDPWLWWNRVHPDDRERLQAEEERCAKTLEPLSVEYRIFAADGRMLWVRDEGAMGRPVDGGRVQLEGVLIDITERRRAEEELRHRAEHDELTGLANRRRFADELRHRRADGTDGTVVIIDVDHLKYVNDSLGHAAGDAMLRSIATALSDVIRPGEFLARFGGDEFTVLLDMAAERAVRRRLAALLRGIRARQSQLPARASAGAVSFGTRSQSTDEDLMIAADIALHEAKERGGDRYEIFSGTGAERLAWVGRVREAIDADRLVLYEQPIFDLATGERAGAEMLVRMVEEDGSVLAPGAFLPTAERFGLMGEIDRLVISKALDGATSGQAVTVNLSARSISDPGLSAHISSTLERTGARPEDVVFELTETAAATASEDLREFGGHIERLGCSLAIDDFGTGFGSLTYLKNLPVQYLKVDMEFVRGIHESAADRAIVRSIVTIAESLGMRTIGEGVDDEAILNGLRELGVDYAQGYHLGRPAPLAE